MVRVMGHMSTSGSASRSASGASGRSPRALVERRVRTPELAFPDAGCDTADVLRRFEGAIERKPGVAASTAFGTLIDLRNFEIRESASSGTAQNWSRRVSTQETVRATRLSFEVVKLNQFMDVLLSILLNSWMCC